MNSRQKYYLGFVATIIFLLTLVALVIGLVIHYDTASQKYQNVNSIEAVKILLSIAIVLNVVMITISMFFTISNFARSRQLIRKSFNSFVEDIMTNNNIGIIIYDINQNIIWASNFIRNKFHKDFVGHTVTDFFKKADTTFNNTIDMNETKREFKNNNNIYEAQFWPLSNVIVIRDITTEYLFKVESWEQKPVIGEIEIDNYQMYQSILSEEQLFIINKVVIDTIKDYMQKYNLIYRQYTNGKFVIFTTEESLKLMSKEHFDLFINIHKKIDDGNINKLSLSVGFAHGWSSLKEKLEQAKKALVQAQNRGGDQIAIFSNTSPPVYYGSNNEVLSNNSRIRIKSVALEFSKKLQDPSIKNVMIYGHSLADLDAFGAAYGVYELATRYGKQAYICSETQDQTTKRMLDDLVEQQKIDLNKIFVRAEHATKNTNANTLVVMVDNSDVMRTDNPDALINADRENIFVFDHHRVGKSVDYCPITNIYIDTTASSASEIVTEVITFMEFKANITPIAAQLLLSGIYLDTVQFSKSVTPRTFEAAAFLEGKGADVVRSGNLLKFDDDTEAEIREILKNTTEIKKGYFLAYTDKEVSNDVISIAANEILKIKGRVASFVIAKLKSKKEYKLSARGIDTNVQIICEQVGGGGHFSTAAATSSEDLETFVDNVRHAIISAGRQINDESNIN
ncbi:DHH family phosphoesterase [Mycoplasma sp. Pen4]|uniref:DHH family phosphoesterase n=1 Tax=Mycoplasma sp. Pen4 TaxID=640330 RepID=UPI0016542FB1|nr:DHH family phosphoesterase [Mycoplasma sp. Pen4]QNM93554.1 DHH family phosphoesterase [Mycoplasma sp. Pen4]